MGDLYQGHPVSSIYMHDDEGLYRIVRIFRIKEIQDPRLMLSYKSWSLSWQEQESQVTYGKKGMMSGSVTVLEIHRLFSATVTHNFCP